MKGVEKLKAVREINDHRLFIAGGGIGGREKLRRVRQISDLQQRLKVGSKPGAEVVDYRDPSSVEQHIYSMAQKVGDAFDEVHYQTLLKAGRAMGIPVLTRNLPEMSMKMDDASLFRLNAYSEKGEQVLPDGIDGLLLDPDEIKAKTERKKQIFSGMADQFRRTFKVEYHQKKEAARVKLDSILDDYTQFVERTKPAGINAFSREYRRWEEENKKEIARFKSAITRENNRLDAVMAEWERENFERFDPESRAEIARIDAELERPGRAIIDAAIEQSTVTHEDAENWVNQQIIDKSAVNKLKKRGYSEGQLKADMAEFYRITGGKLGIVRIKGDGGNRAFAHNAGDGGVSTVHVSSSFSKRTLWHELGHHIEFLDAEAEAAAHAFLKKRRHDDNLYRLQDISHSGYKSSEVAWKDDFFDPYVGRHYKHGATEVFSMGIECLSDPKKAAMLRAKDPEHLNLVLGYVTQPLSVLSQMRKDSSESTKVDKLDKAESRKKLLSSITSLSKKKLKLDPMSSPEVHGVADMDNFINRGLWYAEKGEPVGSMPGDRSIVVLYGKMRVSLSSNRLVKGYRLITLDDEGLVDRLSNITEKEWPTYLALNINMPGRYRKDRFGYFDMDKVETSELQSVKNWLEDL